MQRKKLGSLKNYEDCLFVNVGTGIGGATFIKGELLQPKRYTGFEFGHMVIQKNGRQCTCGKKGCFETYCSIRAFKEDVKNELGIKEDITGKQLFKIIEENQEKLRLVINEYIENLSIAIGNLIDIFEPEAICFGGSFAYYEEILLSKLIENLKEKKTFNEGQLPTIVIAELQNDAGILGAIL